MQHPELVGLIGIVILLVIMYLRVWVGIAMLVIGFLGIVILIGWPQALAVLGTVPYTNVASYTLAALPLFVMMGTVLTVTGIGGDLFYSAYKWLGHHKGGLAMATSVASAILGVVTDSMVAAITMGKLAMPEMKKYKYDEGLGAGSIVAGASLATLIPPSIGFILFAMLTGESVGELFIGSILPGCLLTLIIILIIIATVRINPKLAPAGPKTSMKDKIKSLKFTWAAMLLILVIIGGIYAGIFTPTESGAVGAAGALIIGAASKRLSKKVLIESILETTQMTAMIILMTAGAFVFSNMITISKLSFVMSDFIVHLELNRYLIFLIIVIMYIVLGMFTDILAAILLTVPILHPIVKELGFDPVWFGVVVVILIEIGFITPPFGMNVFTFSAICKVPIAKVFRGVIPFVLAMIICIIILTIFPEIVTFLPETMR